MASQPNPTDTDDPKTDDILADLKARSDARKGNGSTRSSAQKHKPDNLDAESVAELRAMVKALPEQEATAEAKADVPEEPTVKRGARQAASRPKRTQRKNSERRERASKYLGYRPEVRIINMSPSVMSAMHSLNSKRAPIREAAVEALFLHS